MAQGNLYVGSAFTEPGLTDPDCTKEVNAIEYKMYEDLLNRVHRLERFMLLASNVVPGLKDKRLDT